MTDNNADYILKTALATFDRENPIDQELPQSTSGTKGKWLEHTTTAVAPFIKDWDIAQAWQWDAWPERQTYFPQLLTAQDPGIDVVAVTNDGDYIAIQCKARKLDNSGRGGSIGSAELNKFIANATNQLWSERWLATNGDNPISKNSLMQTKYSDPNRPIKEVNVHADVLKQLADDTANAPEPCPHCKISCVEPDPAPPNRPNNVCRTTQFRKASLSCKSRYSPIAEVSP